MADQKLVVMHYFSLFVENFFLHLGILEIFEKVSSLVHLHYHPWKRVLLALFIKISKTIHQKMKSLKNFKGSPFIKRTLNFGGWASQTCNF